jgi:hypothetical protein
MLSAAQDIRAQMLNTDISADCKGDLDAVGVSQQQVIDATQTINILNGWGSQYNYADAAWRYSSAWSSQRFSASGNQTVGDFFSNNPGTVAIAQGPGHDIFVDPTWVNSYSDGQLKGLVLHELLHNISGQVDTVLQGALRLPDGKSSNIADKLQKDCF